jgi:sugar lactone lactonase YvrE
MALLLAFASLWVTGCGGGGGSPPLATLAIVSQPVNQSVVAGTSATFSVSATGASSYQWQRNSVGVWTNIVGATTATYTVSADQLVDGQQVRVVVSDGTMSVTSAAVTLTVTATVVAASIQTQPQSVLVVEGQNAIFSVGAGGTTPSYRWQVSSGGAVWSDIPGATSPTLIVVSVTLADQGKQFRVIVSNAAGSATSDAAVLSLSGSLAIVIQPISQSVVAGTPATFSVSATGASAYQWQRGSSGVWTNVTGATGVSYTIPADQLVDGQQVRVIVSNGTMSLTSSAATLTVTAAIVAVSIQTHPLNVSVVEGLSAIFTVGAGGSSPSYRWQVSADGTLWTDIPNATAATLVIAAANLADNGKRYRVVASNAAGSATSNAAVLSVSAEFSVVTGGDACGQASCSGDSGDGSGVGSGAGDGGDGAGPGLSAMRNVNVTAYKPDGKVLGTAPLGADYLVSLYPLVYKGPFILRFADNGTGTGQYFDESKRAWLPLQGQALHVMVPSLTHHVSANPVSEAAYQWALKQYGSEAALTASAMQQANALMRAQLNAKLPSSYQTNDITNYVTPVSDVSGTGTLTNTWAGRYGAVMAALPIAGSRFNSILEAPALAFSRQLTEDIKDDGIFNISATLPAVSTAYDGSVANQLSAGICSAIAVWGSQALPSQLAPQTAGSAVPGQLTLLAGSLGGRGNCDGWGANARFSTPSGVAVDGQGNVYVADLFNSTIRKITPSGGVFTLAGTPGKTGSADGTGSAARFYVPQGVAVDSGGFVYVADSGNNTIRKITPGGTVSTLAGTAGTQGGTNGTGSAARFFNPRALAVDGSGNVFVADNINNAIRKVTPAGVVTTFAGTIGSAGFGCSSNLLNGPEGVTVDGAGNVYVASDYGVICKITSAGSMSQLADGSSSADGAFNNPRGLAVDAAGNVFVADSFNEIVRRVSPAGVVTTLAGLKVTRGSLDGTGSAARFRRPNSVAVDAAGNVYVADQENHTIRKITGSGVVTTMAGSASAPGSANGTGTAAQFNGPGATALDAAGNVYLADTLNYTIRRITPAGLVTTFAGTAGVRGSLDGTGASAQFRFAEDGDPVGVAIDPAGNLFVADTGSQTIRRITPGGVVTTFAGGVGLAGSIDATGINARFSSPRSLAIDTGGNLFVADMFNHTIRRITPGGVVTTLAGTAGQFGSANGTGPAARFDQPTGVATDSVGNVYVADLQNQTIRKVTSGGVVTTLAGTAKTPGNADGVGAAARFSYPVGVAADAEGNVYVADPGLEFTAGREANTVRKITPTGAVTTVVGRAGSVGNILGALPASLGKISSVGVVTSKRLVITSDNGVFLATFE